MRRWLGVVLAVSVVVGVSGCTPVIGGLTGLSVDSEGHPVIVLAWCEGATPDGVKVYHYEEPVSTSPGGGSVGSPVSINISSSSTVTVDDAHFNAPSLDGQSASFRIDEPADGWTVEPESFAMVPGVEYHAFGGNRDHTFSIAHVYFTGDDIENLKPGMVLIQQYDEKKGDWVDVMVSQENFDRQGQDPSRCA
ncbi:hypothetical protein AB0G15_25185 [Streptosporangium sp. NPDC023825]|uniref:hypothetical protein n=1 Tax=Streptosporangium sp. NPDC023825 TaxID=3154909 RepID=UPI003416C3E9